MREAPEPNRFVPGDALYEQYTTRGKRLIFEGPDGVSLKVRVRRGQVRVYDSALRAVGRVRFAKGGQIKASAFGDEERTSSWVNADVAELAGHWRVERADRDWAIFDAEGELLGLLHPPRRDDDEGNEEARVTPEDLDAWSADDTILYAALNLPVPHDGATAVSAPNIDGERAARATSGANAQADAVAEAFRATESAHDAAQLAVQISAPSARDEASESAETSESGVSRVGWTLSADYRDRDPLKIDRDTARPRALHETGEVLLAAPAARSWSDPALLVLTLDALAPLSRQALASWVDRNLVEQTERP